jgi:hypothetical protein
MRYFREDYIKGNYKGFRSKGTPIMALKYDYSDLIARGLVLAIQDNSLVIVDYPTAVRRKLAFDWQSIARFQERKHSV